MSRGAEESLMALLEAMLTLAAQDVSMRRPKPTIKPGGYQEEIFMDLSEEEKDEMSCSICYQVLKETMQCVNRHKFCHSCLYVWSTTGQYANRVRCPVCRAHGYYFRNEDLDQRIGCKKVRCQLESCKWSGPLRHLQVHQHTTYGSRQPTRADSDEEEEDEEEEEDRSDVLELPYLGRAPPRLPHRSQSRFTGTGLRARTVMAPAAVSAVQEEEENGNSPVTHTTTTRLDGVISGVGGILLRERRSSNGNGGGGAAAGGSHSPTRLTVRQRVHPIRRSTNNRISISHTDNNNNQAHNSSSTSLAGARAAASESTPTTPRTPRPPSAPRPPNTAARRNLPGLSQRGAPRLPSGNSGLSSPSPAAPATFNAASVGRTNGLGENLTEIRDRLQESRSRLDTLMTTFNGELERSRQEMAEFQVERERQRQEQLNEVRELGRRLGQVASELRRLLDHRRPFRPSDD